MIEHSTWEKWSPIKVPNKIFNYKILNKQILLLTGSSGNDVAKFIDIHIITNKLISKLK